MAYGCQLTDREARATDETTVSDVFGTCVAALCGSESQNTCCYLFGLHTEMCWFQRPLPADTQLFESRWHGREKAFAVGMKH
jgi:hypothetical protein